MRTKTYRTNLPKPDFNSIEDLDRLRNIMLGLPILKKSSQVPFGYEVSRNNPLYLIPVQREFDLLVEAKKHLKTCSFTEVAQWLTEHTGRPISHEGLYKIMKHRAPDDRATLPLDDREKL